MLNVYCSLVFNGSLAKYTPYVEQGDPDYTALMDRLNADPDNLIYNTVEEGIRRLRSGRTVIIAHKMVFNSFINKNPRIFADEKLFIIDKIYEPSIQGLIFTLNSPLRPLFDRAITKLREGGTYDFLKRKW